ncbi:MAG: hypothetical protein KAT56_03905 [Sedimentisphaerales bacterium]|nr:hypothetical protein [Sedimentisphaerales bacterium]
MAETIESFVNKLQEEGVQEGQAAAEKIRSEAQGQARQIVEEARAEAEKAVNEAQEQAKTILEKGRTELRLAARDASLKLRTILSQALKTVMGEPVEAPLADAEFLTPLLHDIIMQYAQADSGNSKTITINVSPEMQKQLANWAIGELHKAVKSSNTRLDLKGTLNQAGFEYRIDGATVEVTVDSVVVILSELVAPQLAELLDQAMKSDDN